MDLFNKVVDPLKPFWNNYARPVTSETIRILPDSLLWGSGFLSLLTFSPAYFIFFIAILEFFAVQNIFGSLLMSISPSTFQDETKTPGCATGYKGPSFYQLSLMTLMTKYVKVPNPLMFVLSCATFYIMAMYYEFQEEYASLGPMAVDSVKTSAILSGVLLLLVYLWRVFIDSCDSPPALFISLLLGFVGAGVFYVNKSLFGRDAVNLRAIPSFTTDRKAVCVTK